MREESLKTKKPVGVSIGRVEGVKENVVRGVRRVMVYMVMMPLGVRGEMN